MNGENILKRSSQFLGVVAGGALILYILGFIIVETFIFSMKLEGIFWLSDEFYMRAGGRFFLDAVQSALFTFFVIFPLLFLLCGLLPTESQCRQADATGNASFWKYRIRIFTFYFIISLAFCTAISFDTLLGVVEKLASYVTSIFTASESSVEVDRLAEQPVWAKRGLGYRQALLVKLKTFVYFDLIMPVAIVFGVYLYRARPSVDSGHSKGVYYSFLFPVFLIYIATFIMSYGIYVYDWQLVKLEGIAPGELGVQPSQGQGSLAASAAQAYADSSPTAPAMQHDEKPSLYEDITGKSGQHATGFPHESPYPVRPDHEPYRGLYLIGHVSENYLFLEKTNLATIGHILSADKDELPHLRFNLEKTHTLRELLRRVKAFSKKNQPVYQTRPLYGTPQSVESSEDEKERRLLNYEKSDADAATESLGGPR